MKLNRINYKLMTLLGMATLITACGTTGTYIGYSNTGDLPEDYKQPPSFVIRPNINLNEHHGMSLHTDDIKKIINEDETTLHFYFDKNHSRPMNPHDADISITLEKNDNFEWKTNDYHLIFDKESENLYGIIKNNGQLHAFGAGDYATGELAIESAQLQKATYKVSAIGTMDKSSLSNNISLSKGSGEFHFKFGDTNTFEGELTLDGNKLTVNDGVVSNGHFNSTIKGDGKKANLDGIFTGEGAEGITGGWEGDEMLGAFSGKRD